MVYVIVLGQIIVLGAKLCVRRYVGFHPLKTIGKKTHRRSEENLATVLIFAWYGGPHCIGPGVVMKLILV
jgi:hypothetical protein